MNIFSAKRKENAKRYDAFLSYSRAGDEALAPILRDALHKVAKPWFRRRAMHVFLDRSNLSANPALWPNIERALGNSRFLILMCSPAAAASKWVEREVKCWLESGSPEQLLLVLTDGELSWNENAADFDWEQTNSIPGFIKGLFSEEPLYVDMRWAKKEPLITFDDSRFLEATLNLAAPIRGVEKEDLASEEVRQHRRTRHTAWIAGISLLILLAGSIVFGIAAVQRGIKLKSQLIEAERARLVAQNELGRRLNIEGKAGEAIISLTGAIPEPLDPQLNSEARAVGLELARTLLSAGQITEARFSQRPVDEGETLTLSNEGTRLAMHKSQISIGHDVENNKIEIFDTDGARKLSTVYIPGRELISKLAFVDGPRLLYLQPAGGEGIVVESASGNTIASIPRFDVDWVAQKTARLLGYDRDTGVITVVDLTTGATILRMEPPGDARLRRLELVLKDEIAVILYTDGSLVLLRPSDVEAKRLTAPNTGKVLQLWGSLAGSNSVLVSTDTEAVAVLNAATGEFLPMDGDELEEMPADAALLPGNRIAYIEELSSSWITFEGGLVLRPTKTEVDSKVETLVGTTVADGVLAGDGSTEVSWVSSDDKRSAVVISDTADPMTSLVVSKSLGLLVVGHQSGAIRLRRAPGMEETHVLRGHTAKIMELWLSEDGTELVSASADGTVRRWWIMAPAAQVLLNPRLRDDGVNMIEDIARRRLALAPSGQLLAIRDDDHLVSVWTVDGEQRFTFNREDSDLTLDFGFTPDSGRVYVVDDMGMIDIIGLDGTSISQWGEVAPRIDVFSSSFIEHDVTPFFAFDSTGTRIVTTDDNLSVYLWDLSSPTTPTLLSEYYNSGSEVVMRDRVRFEGQELVWQGDYESLVLSSSGSTPTNIAEHELFEELLAVDTVSGRVATRVAEQILITSVDGKTVELVDPPPVTHAWFSADGTRILTANMVGIDFQNIAAWRTRDGHALGRIGDNDNTAYTEVHLNRDGSRLLTRPVLSGSTKLWDLDTGRLISSFGPAFVKKLAFSPDGRHFFIASSLSTEGQGGVWLRDATSGESIWQEVSIIFDPSGVTFSPDGNQLLVYDRSNYYPGIPFASVLLVDTESGKLIKKLSSPVGRILDAAFDQSGKWLYGMTEDGAVVRWRTLTRAGEAQQLARDLAERWQLTESVSGE